MQAARTSTAESAGAAGAPRVGPFAAILAAARAAGSLHDYYRAALECVAAHFQAPYAALSLRADSQPIEHECHRGPSDPGFWRPTVQAFLTEALAAGAARARMLSARQADLQLVMMAVPLPAPAGEPLGALALVVRVDDREAMSLAVLLTSVAALMSSGAALVGAARERDAPGAGEPLLARAAQARSLTELAFTLVNNARTRFACTQVALGMVRGARVVPVAVSGMERVRERAPGIKALRAAMEEGLDHGGAVRVAGGAAETAFRLHEAWRRDCQADGVATVPLGSGDRVVAVVALSCRGDEPLEPQRFERIRSTLAPFGPALDLVAHARRSLPRHTADRVRQTLAELASPGRWGRMAGVLFGVAAVAWFLFGTLPYRVAAQARVTAAAARQIAAPLDAVLAEAPVVAGDRVRAGELLCRFDVSELELERRALQAQLRGARLALSEALAAGDAVAASGAAARRDELIARLDLAELRIAAALVVAPHDGIIVRGDLRQRVGESLPRGAPLFELAPRQAWAFEIDLPQYAIGDVAPGAVGAFATHGQPDVAHRLEITHVGTAGEPDGGRVVFRAEALAAGAGDRLRPGMEGVARVELGARPVWWLTLHRLIDTLRVNFWL